jgi:hypothetical protein
VAADLVTIGHPWKALVVVRFAASFGRAVRPLGDPARQAQEGFRHPPSTRLHPMARAPEVSLRDSTEWAPPPWTIRALSSWVILTDFARFGPVLPLRPAASASTTLGAGVGFSSCPPEPALYRPTETADARDD